MDYPVDLTKARWLEKKGLVMKVLDKTLLDKTDMGRELEKLHAAYRAVDWINLSAKGAYGTLEALDKDEAQLPGRFKKVTEFQAAIPPLIAHAKNVHPILKNQKLVPKGVSDYVAVVITKSEDLKKSADKVTLAELKKGYDTARQSLKNTQKIAAQVVMGWIPKIKAGIVEVRKKPNAATYNEKLWQSVRGMGTSAAKYDYLGPVQPEWKTLTSIQPNTLKDEKAILAHLLKIEALVKKTEPLFPK
jgi:hypothetical protein